MAKILQIFVSVLLVVVAVEVSAQTHHVVGGDGGWTPASDITSWLSGRVFRVGDKIWFTYDPATEESIVELQNQEDFESCNLQNPIKMYTDAVKLEEEGIRYFTSGNLESCKNGLKLPVPVQAHSEFGPSEPFQPTFGPPPPEPFHPPTPTFGPPPEPFHPPPTSRPPPPKPFHPPPTEPFHPPPPEPFHPPPTEPFHPPPTVGPPPPEHFKPPPPVPVQPPPTIKSPPPPPPSFRPPPPKPPSASPPPPPPFEPPVFVPPPPSFGPPPPRAPSASNNLNGLSYGLFVGLGFCYMGLHL